MAVFCNRDKPLTTRILNVRHTMTLLELKYMTWRGCRTRSSDVWLPNRIMTTMMTKCGCNRLFG